MIVKIRGNGKVESITAQSHDWVYRDWTQGLPPTTIQHVFDAVNEYINREDRGEVITASGILAADWNGQHDDMTALTYFRVGVC